MKKVPVYFVLLLVIAACKRRDSNVIRPGYWQGNLEVMDGRILPFGFSVKNTDSTYMIELFNAKEVIEIDEIQLLQDSIYIQMPVFEDYIAGTYNDTLINGNFINKSRERKVPFRATYGKEPRFPADHPPAIDVSGTWEVYFSPGTEEEYPAKGIFEQQNNQVRGTFRTKTGDYRYLEGSVSGDSLNLSTFDGAHAYLFVASVSDSLINGTFYSGNHFKEPFTGHRNPGFELQDENTLTYLKEGFERLQFEFPDTEGKSVSLADDRFKDKVVIVQIMGSWCPNCLDETKFLVEYLETQQKDGLEVVALAFEYARTPQKAFASIKRLRDRVGVPYPILLAQYGSGNKLQANEKLPMLNQILSYPTTIFIDKNGRVRNIHTGFNGPATGKKYEEFKIAFDSLVQQLLSE